MKHIPLVCHAENGVFLLCEGPVTYRLRWYHRLMLWAGLVTEVELETWFRGQEG